MGLTFYRKDAFPNLQDSLLAHRILGNIYLLEEDYQNAISVSEKGLQLVRKYEVESGKNLDQ